MSASTARFVLATLITAVLIGCGGSPAIPAPGSSGGRGPSAPPGASGAPGVSGAPGLPGVPGQPAPVAGSIDSCSILSDEEIRAATGEGVTARQASTLTQVFPSVCDIPLDNGGSLTVSVRTTGGRSMYETSFEPFIGQDGIAPLDEAVPGLGDKAGRSGDDELMVLKDDVLFDIFFIEFGRQDKLTVLRYLAEIVLAKMACGAAGCPGMTLPPMPTAGPVVTPTPLAIDPGSLPSTGAQTRVVNLYSENGQPVEVDVYGYAWSDTEMREVGALVASVPYASASAWFNPGLVQSPYGGDPYTKIDIFRHGETSNPLAGVGEFLGPDTVTTIAIWQEEVFEGQPGAWTSTIYAEHPDYEVPRAPEGKAILLGNDGGLDAEKDVPFLYASVGKGCLESSLGRSDPDFPNVQPLTNELAIAPGQYTLTVHESPVGEVPTCAGKALGPGAPITVAAGDRLIAFPYRLPGQTPINLLVVPYGAP